MEDPSDQLSPDEARAKEDAPDPAPAPHAPDEADDVPTNTAEIALTATVTGETVDPDDEGRDEEESAFEAAQREHSATLMRQLCHEFISQGMTGKKYRMGDKIAEGGMGLIYTAEDRGLGRNTVLKVIRPEMMTQPDRLLRFVEEARISGQLEHPNITPVHDMGALTLDRLFFSMKYIEGEPLDAIISYLRRGRPEYVEKFNLFKLLTIFRKICDAVAFAHSRGIIHRDIKPDNIMVGAYGEVLLVDWGLARPESHQDRLEAFPEPLREELGEADLLQTLDGMIKGTPAYMAPEQAEGVAGRVDRRTDIFLLGSTLYAIATLHPPYEGKDLYLTVDAAEACDFEPPESKAPERDIPNELNRIILKAMARDPFDRYQSVDELSEDVDSLLAGHLSSELRTFSAGTFLMQEGEVGDRAFVIASGEVEVYRYVNGQRLSLSHLVTGDVVGEMALISHEPRSASVVALSETVVFVITEGLMDRGMANLSPWLSKVVHALTERLRKASAVMHPLNGSDCSYHVMNQLRLLYVSWSQPQYDELSGRLLLTLDTGEAIFEIANNLCISQDQVTAVLVTLFEAGFIETFGEYELSISNFELFGRFIDFTRQKLGFQCGLQDDRAFRFRGSFSGQVSVSSSLAHMTEIEEEMQDVFYLEDATALDCHGPGQVEERFEEVFQELHQLPVQSHFVPPRDSDLQDDEA